MLNQLLDLIEGVIFGLTWRRFFALVLLIGILWGVLFTFEHYTSHFRLRKLEKATALLSTLQEIDGSKSLESNEELSTIRSNVILELQEITQQKPLLPPFKFSFPLLKSKILSLHSGFWKFIIGSSPWIIILVIRKFSSKPMRGIIMRFLVFILISGGFGIILPEFFLPIGNLIIYPIGSFILLFLILFFWAKEQKT